MSISPGQSVCWTRCGQSSPQGAPLLDYPASAARWWRLGHWRQRAGAVPSADERGSRLRGNVYVAEVDNSRVQVFSPEGEFLTEVAAGTFATPHGIAFDSKGALYVGDTGDNVVRKFRLVNGPMADD